MPQVSVIIPIYNVDRYLSQCIESALNQTIDDIEVILVDDGSIDSSPEICDRYVRMDDRVRVIHKANGGLSSARNSGLDVASGKWICFLDADDWLATTRFEEMLAFEQDDLDIIIGGFTQCLRGKERLRHPVVRPSVYSNEYILNGMVYQGQFAPVWTSLYRHSLIKNNRMRFLPNKEIYPEDTLFNAEAYSKARLVRVIASCGYYYRLHNQSISHSYQANLFVRMVKQLEYECSILSNNFGEDFSDVRQKKAPGYVAIALFKESLCDKKTAKANIRAILDSSFAKEAFSGKCDFMYGGNRYWPFYILGKLGCVNGIYCLSKLYKKGEGIYRLLK